MSRSLSCLLVIIAVSLFSSAFAADPNTPTSTIPETYFGLHIHHLEEPPVTPWPNMPVPTWRLWDAGVNWPDLEPSKGRWQFERLDRYVSLASQHGTSILLPLGGSPTWASAHPRLPSNYQPGFTAEPANLDDWCIYVQAVVSRYKGRIQAYEIWNEPNLKDFWSGTTEQMLVLTKAASEIIRRVDPRALVVSPAATADYGIPWLAEFLRKGGGQYVDVIGFHFYVNPHTRSPEEMLPVIQRVREVIAENGLATKPLWNTECGWLVPARFDSEEIAAAFLARAYILAWAAGVERFYWYAWDNWGLAIVTYRPAEHVVTPAGYAYKLIEQWLVGSRMEACSETPDHIWVCRLSRSGKKEWIVWSSAKTQSFNISKTWQVTSVTTLLHERRPLNANNIDVGPIPILLRGDS